MLESEAAGASLPALPPGGMPAVTPIADLLALRDEGNRAIAAMFGWLDAGRASLAEPVASGVEKLLRAAMRAEVDIELKNSPRPLFAEMSSGQE